MKQIYRTDSSYITLRDVWEIFTANIWLFLWSIAICLTAAIGYIIITPPLYTRTASILIKSDTNSSSGELTLEGMGILSDNTDLKDEIHMLTTPQLMEEVVRRLSLHTIYRIKHRGLRWQELYHKAPFEVNLNEALLDDDILIHITTDGRDSFEIEKLTINEERIAIKGSWQFQDRIETPYGAFTIDRQTDAMPTESRELYSFTKKSVAQVAQHYIFTIDVTIRDTSSSIVDLSLTTDSAAKSEDILNTIILVYKENWLKDKNLISLSTTEFINERLKIIAHELGDIDLNISEYKSENQLPSLEAVTGVNFTSTNENLQRQVELRNKLTMANYLISYVGDTTTNDLVLPVNAGEVSSAIDAQLIKYNEVLQQKRLLLSNSSEKNPIVADLTQQLSVMRSALTLSLKDHIKALNIELQSARREEMLAQKRLSQNPLQELYLLSAGREQSIKEALYLFLLQKREESELSQTFTAHNTKILSPAMGEETPVAPQRALALLVGLMVGVIIPIVIIILRRNLNTTINSKSDLAALSIPFLGSIPYIGKRKRSIVSRLKRDIEVADPIVVTDSGRDLANESFRVVRTNLDFMALQGGGCRVICVTSYNPASGKSFISLNLSKSVAIKSKRVLLIDADFRRGTLSKAVDTPLKGVVNYLNGSVGDLEQIIVKDKFHDMLDILPMGVMPPNPTELLLMERFEIMINSLKERYDYIIFDCPPIEIVPDTIIVERFCDSTIFVIRAGLMDRRQLPELEELYVSKRLKSMCLILNAVDPEHQHTYGCYGYYGNNING